MFNVKKHPKWIHHICSARLALVSALGYHSISAYERGDYKYYNYNKRAAESLRSFVQYCIQKLEGDEEKVIILNREYKPIGYGVEFEDFDNWVDYRDFDSAIASINSPAMKALLKACGKDSAGRDWLWFTFNDLTAPWNGRKNAERLVKLIDVALKDNL